MGRLLNLSDFQFSHHQQYGCNYVTRPQPGSEPKFGCSSLERPKLERQVLVKRKVLFRKPATWEDRGLAFPRPSPKFDSEQEPLKGEIHRDGKGLAVDRWLEGRLAGLRETVCSQLPEYGMPLSVGAPGEIPAIRKGWLEGKMERTSKLFQNGVS